MRRSLYLLIFIVFLMGLVPAVGQAQFELDEIVIWAPTEKPQVPLESSTIDIPLTTQHGERVDELIQKTAGVHIRRFGGLEAATSVSIRGASAAQVDIFLDGVPLSTASGEGIGLSHIFSSELKSLQVFKSLAPLELGGVSAGGVIQLNSQKPAPGWQQRYSLGIGSFYTKTALASVKHGGKNHELSFGVSVLDSRGDFSFLDNNGTPLNTSDDAVVTRQNNQHRLVHPHVHWKYHLDDQTELFVSQHFFRVDSGVPGLENFQSQTASRDVTEWLSQLRLSRNDLWQGRASWQNQVYFRFIKSQFEDLNGEVGLGAAQDNDNRTLVFGERFLWQMHFGEDFGFNKSLDYRFEGFTPKDHVLGLRVGTTSKRHRLAVGLEPWAHFFDKRFKLKGQLQSLHAFYSISDDDPSLPSSVGFTSNRVEHPWSASVFAAYHANPVWTLKASASRAVRLPKFTEMFGDQGHVLGNPQLVSEKTFKYSVGVLVQKAFSGWLKAIEAELNHFGSWTDDLIQFELGSGFARAANVGKARVLGIEQVLTVRFDLPFTLSQNYSYTQAKDLAVNPGNFLVGRPQHELNTSLRFDHKRLEASADINYTHGQYLDSLNTQRVDHRVLLHAQLGYWFSSAYRLTAAAKNLTNSQVVDAVGFPLPGRSFWLGFEVFWE